jgi:hypothetical protein
MPVRVAEHLDLYMSRPLNKFFNVEGRINALVDILQSLKIDESILGGDSLRWLKQFRERSAAQEPEKVEQAQINLEQ